MSDRLTVLKGLHEARCLLEDIVPARYRGKALEAVCDAILMLDAKVMTINELTSAPAGTVVWEEFWSGKRKEPDHRISPMIKSKDGYYCDEDGGVEIESRDLYDEETGNRRRFWTNKPTMEMRKFIAWEIEEEQQ